MIIRPKNWKTFQHYKSRRPPWIRLYRTLLDDFDFQRLPLASKALAPLLWLLASESMNGEIDADVPRLALRLRMTESDVSAGLTPLIDSQFFESALTASAALAAGLQRATSETEAEKRQRQRESAHARDPFHGEHNAGTALTGMPSAEELLDESRNAWREVDGCDPDAMTQWLAHWSRKHDGRDMPAHQRIATAKLLAGLGDADTQRRAVGTAEAAGWKALRHGDGRAPQKSKAEKTEDARKESERIEWANLAERAERVGFRPRTAKDDLDGYRYLVQRAEANQPRGGSKTLAELLARTQ